MANVQCDKCERHFDIKPKEKKHGKGVVETYFTCPHCRKHYTAFVTNAVVRRKQREIKELYETLSTITDFQKYQDRLTAIERKKQELQPLMTGLKEKYGK